VKILYLTSRLPWPLDKGDKLRAYHQIRQLSERHEVYLFSLTDKNPSSEDLGELRAITKDVKVFKLKTRVRLMRLLFALVSRRPFQLHWFYQRSAQKMLSRWIQHIEPDGIFCQLIRMAPYVQHAYHIPRILDYMDALSAGIARQSKLAPWYLRWIYSIEFQRLRAYEGVIFDYFDGKMIISEADRKLIFHPESKLIQVVPNGIDTTHFSPQRVFEAKAKGHTILFTGNMSYPPNVDAAVQLVNKIIPLLKTENVKVVIAGTNPAPPVRRLKSTSVEVTGWIRDIRDAYSKADVFVAPLRIGTGQQNKILEAMSMQLPCVTTKHVLNGFPSQLDEHPPFIVADSPTKMAREIDELFTDRGRRKELGELSRNWVSKNCNWQQTTDILADTFVSYIKD